MTSHLDRAPAPRLARACAVLALGAAVLGWAWPRYGGRAVVEVPHPVLTADPVVALDLADMLAVSLTHKTLLTLDPDRGTLVPHLLAALPTSSKDGRLFTLKLRPGLRFGDGTTLDAAALKASFVRLLGVRESRAARVVTAGLSAEGIQVVDELTVQLSLNPPDPQFPLRLTLFAASPRSAVGAGTGPFQPEPHLGPDVVLGVNLFDSHGRPFLDHVVLRPFKSRREARVAAQQGDLDVRCAQDTPLKEGGPTVMDRALVLVAPESLPEREAWLRWLSARRGLHSLARTLGGSVAARSELPGEPPNATEVSLVLDESSPVARLVAQRMQLLAHATGRDVLIKPMRATALRAIQEQGEPVLTLVDVPAPPRDPSLTAALALPPDQAEALTLAVVKDPGRAADKEEEAGVAVLLNVPVQCSVPSAALPGAEGQDRFFTASRRTLLDAVDANRQLTLERAWWR